MVANNKFEYKKLLGIYGSTSEETIKERYEESYNNIMKNIKYVENVHGMKEITIFDKYTEGLELLRYAEKITIIKERYGDTSDKTESRIRKLQKINKNVKIEIENEFLFGGGLMQLVAFGAQDHYLSAPKPKITMFKVSYKNNKNIVTNDKIYNKKYNNRHDKTYNKKYNKMHNKIFNKKQNKRHY